MNFDGVQIGEVLSLKLDTPSKVVAEVRVDKSAPIRKDTVVGLEYQGPHRHCRDLDDRRRGCRSAAA